ncbi:hypothetical protein LY13_001920 [Prauserella aidingensis]|uniref:hypothetical protein n=1 Tax=Prauserella aidingensis TaxID=387890 RepID=UPI0020A3056C|nr:hypothetical protein [Prauserella aidingensis]MCP2253172.1 hypothetical protein [Prauserella aidingensis]
MARPSVPRDARSQGRVTPLLAGIVSAMALAGAAVFTVGYASCGDPGQYVRHADNVHFIGGCVDGEDLPATGPGDQRGPAGGDDEAPRNYRP